MNRKVVVIPCSGIGKSLGSVTRETAYELCENLRPDRTELVALSKLVLGEAEARQRVHDHPAVTIDGCQKMCAATLVRHSGGVIARQVAVFEEFRRYRELKPEGIAELNEAGKQLARALARDIAAELDPITEGGTHA
jgi:uncharacterized metal-binding protein